MSRCQVALLILLCALCSCDSTGRTSTLPPADPGLPPAATKEQIHDAELAIEAIDKEVTDMRGLPVAARKARELAFGKRLEQALPITINTKFENKNIYFLAYWRLTYADGQDADQLLDRLDRLPNPIFKGMGGFLRVQLRLHQGRIREARTLAEGLVARMKEFAPLLDQVAFHECVGQPAPRLPGHNIGGGSPDPMTRSEPWLLYVFVEQLDDNASYLITSYRQMLSTLSPPGQVHVVIVTCEGTALEPVARLHQLMPPQDLPDLIWANPNQGGDADAWRTAWKLPQPLPHVSLIGPDRSIMAVDISPESLSRVLSGRGRAEASSPPSGTAPSGTTTPAGTAPAAAPGK
jgi:hypothetical protein